MKSLVQLLRGIASGLLLVTLLLAASCGDDSPSPGTGAFWVRKNNFPGGIYDSPPVFIIGTKAYMLRAKELWVYDPAADSWTKKTSIPHTISGDKDGAFAFALNGKGFVGCGGGSVNSKDFWQYDPATDTWTQKTDFPGVKRSEALSFVAGGKAYVIGGENNSDGLPYLTDVWEFDATADQWTQKNNFNGPGRIHANAFAIGNKGYIGIGYNPDVNPVDLNDFYEYDPSTDSWTRKTDFPDPEGRSTAIGFSIGTKGYMGTGFLNVGEGHKDFWEYDPSKNSWTQRQDVGTNGRYWAVGFAIGNTGYVGGGEGGEYDLVKGTDGFDHVEDFVWAYTVN
jgi:N-acetylneuraminic acid mutarotase